MIKAMILSRQGWAVARIFIRRGIPFPSLPLPFPFLPSPPSPCPFLFPSPPALLSPFSLCFLYDPARESGGAL